MAYSSISRLRELTNFSKDVISDNEIRVLTPLADRILNRLITTRHHLEEMAGTIDGTNKFFRVEHRAIADSNYGNVTLLDNCDAITNWTGSTDAIAASVVPRLIQGTYSLALGKSGTTQAYFSYLKEFASTIDGTGKRLKLALYIKDINEITNVTIEIGSATNAFYHIMISVDDLLSGLNELDIDIVDEMGISGSPDIAAIDYFKINFPTSAASSTVASGNVKMDYLRLEDPTELDITDVDVFYATLDTDKEIVYGSRNTLTAVNRREGRVTVATAPTTTTAAEGVFATYRSTVENIDYNLVKDAACYVLAHLCSFKIAGEAPDYASTEDAFLRRDIAGAPDEWLRLAISIANTLLGAQQIGLRRVETKDVV